VSNERLKRVPQSLIVRTVVSIAVLYFILCNVQHVPLSHILKDYLLNREDKCRKGEEGTEEKNRSNGQGLGWDRIPDVPPQFDGRMTVDTGNRGHAGLS